MSSIRLKWISGLLISPLPFGCKQDPFRNHVNEEGHRFTLEKF
jgi:hypothetical protein